MPAEISRACGQEVRKRAELSRNRSNAARGSMPVSGWGATAMTPARCRASCLATASARDSTSSGSTPAPWVRNRIHAHLQQDLHRFSIESFHGTGKRPDEFVPVDPTTSAHRATDDTLLRCKRPIMCQRRSSLLTSARLVEPLDLGFSEIGDSEFGEERNVTTRKVFVTTTS